MLNALRRTITSNDSFLNKYIVEFVLFSEWVTQSFMLCRFKSICWWTTMIQPYHNTVLSITKCELFPATHMIGCLFDKPAHSSFNKKVRKEVHRLKNILLCAACFDLQPRLHCLWRSHLEVRTTILVTNVRQNYLLFALHIVLYSKSYYHLLFFTLIDFVSST